MGFNASSGTVNVTGNVSAVDATFTPSFASGSKNNAGTTALLTVGAGRKCTIIGCYAGAQGINTSSVVATIVANGVTLLTVTGTAGTNNTAVMANDNGFTLPKGSGIVLTAGQVVNYTQGGGSGLTYANIVYIDEAA